MSGMARGRLQGRICLVTGGMRGFGASIVSLFVAHGARCLVLDLLVSEDRVGFYDPYSIEQPTATTATTATTNTVLEGPKECAYALKADVTSRQCWQEALEKSRKIFGCVPSVVVNNAGWTYSNKPTLTVQEDEFDRCFTVNVKSIYLSVDVLLPAMLVEKEQGKGKGWGEDRVFINVSSTAAIRPRPGLVWYNASKGAVSTATKALAVEYAPHKVRFNTVSPVAGNTPLFAGSKEAGDAMTSQQLAQFSASIPIGRLSKGRDIGNACLFLADEESCFLTGIDVAVDGGRCV
ncbi:related to oxidoreductase, short-chain dehydrogenase/reductase [Ustilago bromivora]|uniref:Related to oxidoreductase, short-chain dehydrogenase/reductase n=1 Tax=Ustilago bromivora TaxID=307758 RepID=A0A1K0GZ39_9BASI|nr:related to oxidoreductase, short-chain dehydrogenase/reductase [Ustilago bromivora]